MHAAVKHLAVFGVAISATIPLYHLVSNADAGPSSVPADLIDQLNEFATGREQPYALENLRLLKRTMYFVEEKYVDPSRVDPDQMFDNALDDVERSVPEVLFRREPGGRLLHVAVGSYTTTLDLPPIDSVSEMTDQLSRVALVLESQLSDEVPLPEVEYALINGVLGTLDPHSVLLPPEISAEMDVENSGEFGGLGITITLRDGRLTVEYPLEDTPAFRVGLKADDRIVRIDGESTINMELTEAVSKLRGEVGSTVVVHVEREGWSEPKPFTIERARIKINPVKGELLEGGVGYVRISNFNAMVSADVTTILSQFRRDNGGELRGLVLDLRGNPGGFLHQAVEVSDMFLDSGQIVSTVERGNRNVDEKGASRGNTEADYPIVVLVNANSASASEIVAGALKNRGRAVVVGERTFGKGSVQNLYDNPGDSSKLKLTVAKYLTPGEKSIQAIGIPPDILIEQTIVHETEDGDHLIAMYARERVSREADLDHSLERGRLSGDAPVYSVRHLYVPDTDAVRSDKLQLAEDWQVQFARDLVLASPDEGNRAEVLASVGAVVTTHEKRQGDAIEAAFGEIGLDWAAGTQPSEPQLTAVLDLGEDGVLSVADEEETLWLRVTNEGAEPVHQLMAVSESTFDFLDGDEYYFGRLEPGETRSWPTKIKMIDGYRDEVGLVAFDLHDAQRRDLGHSEHMVRTLGQPLPAFEWSFEITDVGVEGVRGDGDGVAEPGETVAMTLTVTNVGDGATGEAFAKLKNRSGKQLDLRTGVLELGSIEPGASVTDSFIFQVKGSEPLKVEFVLGDQARYDHAAIWRAGFYGFFTQTEELSIPIGVAQAWSDRKPPRIEVTRQPDLVTAEGQVVLSGVARDDAGLRDVIVYQKSENQDGKVFFQGGDEGVTTLPYTVDARLDEGWNLLVVLARDGDGLTDITSVYVWYDPSGKIELAASELPLGG